MQKDFIINKNECDCDEDNNCGCSYPNNINNSDFEQKINNKPTETICICDINAECSCNKIN